MLQGTFHPARSGADAFAQAFRLLCERDAQFAARFAALKHGKKRRYLARTAEELFPGQPELQQSNARTMPGGWLLGLNVSLGSIHERLQMACEVAGLNYGKDLILQV